MCFEGLGMQEQAKIYQIPERKPSNKYYKFQGRFLLDFEVIWGPIWAPFGHARPPFDEKTDSRDLVIFVGHPWARQSALLACFWFKLGVHLDDF